MWIVGSSSSSSSRLDSSQEVATATKHDRRPEACQARCGTVHIQITSMGSIDMVVRDGIVRNPIIN